MKTNMKILILLIVFCIFSVTSTGSDESALNRIEQALNLPTQLPTTVVMQKTLEDLRILNCFQPTVIVGDTLTLNYQIACSISGWHPNDDRAVYAQLKVHNANGNLVSTQEHRLPATEGASYQYVINQEDTFLVKIDASKYTKGSYTAYITVYGEKDRYGILNNPMGSAVSCKFDIITNPKEPTDQSRLFDQAFNSYCQNRRGIVKGSMCTFPDRSFCYAWDFYNGECSPIYNPSGNVQTPQQTPEQQCAATNGVYDSSSGKCLSQAEWQALQQSLEKTKQDLIRQQQEIAQNIKKMGECIRSGGTWIDQGNNNGYCQPAQTPEQKCAATNGVYDSSSGKCLSQAEWQALQQSLEKTKQDLIRQQQEAERIKQYFKDLGKCTLSGGTWIDQGNNNGYCQPAQTPDNMPVPAGPVNIVPAENVMPPVNDEGQVPAGPVEL